MQECIFRKILTGERCVWPHSLLCCPHWIISFDYVILFGNTIPFWLLSLLSSLFWLMSKMIPSWDRKWRGAEGWSEGWAVRTWQTEIGGWSSPPPPTAHTTGYNKKGNLKGTVARDSWTFEGWCWGWAVRTWQREIGGWSAPPPPTAHTAGYNKKGNLKGKVARDSWAYEGWSGGWAVRTWQTEIGGWSSPPQPTAHTAGYNRKWNLKGTVTRDSWDYEGKDGVEVGQSELDK